MSSRADEHEVQTNYAPGDAEKYTYREFEEGLAALRPGDHIEVRVSWLSRPTNAQRTETFHANVDGWTERGLALAVKQTGLDAAPAGGDWSLTATGARTTASDASFDVEHLWRWPADPAPLAHDTPTVLTLDGVAYDRLRALASITTDVTLAYNGTQLYGESLSRSNTSLLATSIPVNEGPREAFDLHVDVEVLAGALEAVGQRASYALTVDGTTGIVEVRHGPTASTAPMVHESEPATIDEWPGGFDDTQTTLLDAHELYGALAGASRAAMTGGEGNVDVATTAEGLTIEAASTDAAWTLPADVEPGDRSRFDAHRLHDAGRFLPAIGSVAVQVGDDYPLLLSYVDVAFAMVPRVTTGGDD